MSSHSEKLVATKLDSLAGHGIDKLPTRPSRSSITQTNLGAALDDADLARREKLLQLLCRPSAERQFSIALRLEGFGRVEAREPVFHAIGCADRVTVNNLVSTSSLGAWRLHPRDNWRAVQDEAIGKAAASPSRMRLGARCVLLTCVGSSLDVLICLPRT